MTEKSFEGCIRYPGPQNSPYCHTNSSSDGGEGKIQGDQKVSVHLMITLQKKPRKNILNSFNHLP
jgi:hypothetical protein